MHAALEGFLFRSTVIAEIDRSFGLLAAHKEIRAC
jgi:hypothetical protein